MGEETILTGYCRALDQSRMVEAEFTAGAWQADCAWPDCPHAAACGIAQALRELPGGENP